jgi:predicted metal-dependent enzyme (double-stranded beta helix superfamily)
VWGLIGMLRGQEASQPYGLYATGALVPQGAPTEA